MKDIFVTFLKSKNFKKIMHIYSKEEVKALFKLLNESGEYEPLPILDSDGNKIFVSKSLKTVNFDFILNKSKSAIFLSDEQFVDEVVHTLGIENIHSTRREVKDVLKKGYTQNIHVQNTVNAFRYIEEQVQLENKITHDSIKKLYNILMNGVLEKDENLLDDHYYRHDKVFVTGSKGIVHNGVPYIKVYNHMDNLIKLINNPKSRYSISTVYSIIHFYVGYIHPYFDGNGRMARMLGGWYLLDQGVDKLFVYTISKLINENKTKYYNAFMTCEQEKFAVNHIVIDHFIKLFEIIGKEIAELLSYVLQFEVMIIQKDNTLNGLTDKELSILLTIIYEHFSGEFSTSVVQDKFASHRTRYNAFQKFICNNVIVKTNKKDKYKLSTEFKIKISSPIE